MNKGHLRLLMHEQDCRLLLDLLLSGLASFDSTTKEFRFNGLRYHSHPENWSTLLDVIGRAKALGALQAIHYPLNPQTK